MTQLSEEFIRGATAEHEAQDEGLSSGAKQVRDVVVGIARLHPDMTEAELAAATFRIFGCTLSTKEQLKLVLDL